VTNGDIMNVRDLEFPERNTEILECELPEKLYLEDYIICPGVTVQLRLIQSRRVLILPDKCHDVRGFLVPRRMFQIFMY
jgi:hypothetical protein